MLAFFDQAAGQVETAVEGIEYWAAAKHLFLRRK